MPQGSEAFNAYFGAATGNLTAYYERWADRGAWSVKDGSWSVRTSLQANFKKNYTNVSLTSAANPLARTTDQKLGVVDNGPFALWPITTGGIAAPGGRRAETLARQDQLFDVVKSGGDLLAFWDDADGALAQLRTRQPPSMSAMTLPLFFMIKDYAVDLEATQMRDPLLAAPVPYLVRNTKPTSAAEPPANATAMAALLDICLSLPRSLSEFVGCLTGAAHGSNRCGHPLQTGELRRTRRAQGRHTTEASRLGLRGRRLPSAALATACGRGWRRGTSPDRPQPPGGSTPRPSGVGG